MPNEQRKILKKKFNIEVKGVDKENKTLEAIFSTQGEDRHGDVIIQNGWDLKYYKKNPVILNSHNHSDATEVIGKVEKGSLKVDNSKLTGKIKFAVDENPKAKIIYDLYAGGYLNAFSVGFLVKEYDNKDYSKITQAELLEISAVSVPANAYALAKQKGIDVDKLYDKSKNKSEKQTEGQPEESNGDEGDSKPDNDEDKENKETDAKVEDNSNKTKGGKDSSDGARQDEGVQGGKNTKKTNKKEDNKEINELKAEISELKELYKKLSEKKYAKEEKIKNIVSKYKNNKLSSLAKINEAIAVVGNHYKGQKSDDSQDNNYLINLAVKELLKLKD